MDQDHAVKGGLARAASLTPEQRSEAARRAVNARWAKHKKPCHCPPAVTIVVTTGAALAASDYRIAEAVSA